LKVTVSNNNGEETTRKVSRKTTETVDKPKAKRGGRVGDDTEQEKGQEEIYSLPM
jgi:hypothetical protein